MTFLLALLVSACAPAAAPTSSDGAAPRIASPKKVAAGVRGTAQVLYAKLNIGNAGLGVADLARMVGTGLTALDDQDELHAALAEAIPSVDNGNWKLNPDGAMETT